MSDEFIPHVRKNDDGTWASPQSLLEHLENTARLAENFSAKFHSEEWGKAVGLAHDAGKGRLVWQKYLQLKSGYDEEAHLEGKQEKCPMPFMGRNWLKQCLAKGLEDLWRTVSPGIMRVCRTGPVQRELDSPPYSFKKLK